MNHPKQERTLVVIKPDGVQRTLIGEIIKRYEKMSLKLIGIKMIVPTEELVEKHYLADPNWKMNVGVKTIASYEKKGEKPPTTNPLEIGEKVLNLLKKYIISGPVIPMVWQGAHAVEVIKKITGGTEPRTSDVGTIRGDFMLDSYPMADGDNRALRNLVHISSKPEDAIIEIPIWFKPEELINYRLVSEQILYDVNLDGILE